MFRSVARRKTDLMPTIPSPRDGHHYSSRSSLSNTPRTPGSRSGNATPGGSLNTSRPGSAMSTSTSMSTSGYVARRATPSSGKERPFSIAVTGVSLDEMNKSKRDSKPPTKSSTSLASAQSTPKRIPNMMSTSMTTTSSTRLFSAEKKTPSKRELNTSQKSPFMPARPISKTTSSERINKSSKDKVKDVPLSMTKSAILVPSPAPAVADNAKETFVKPAVRTPPNGNADKSAASSNEQLAPAQEGVILEPIALNGGAGGEPGVVVGVGAGDVAASPVSSRSRNGSKENSEVRELLVAPVAAENNGGGGDAMTASMIARNSKITTEEEAKAALAERRRLAREEAERQAEMERRRIEAERLAELQRQAEEAERQRQFEEEAIRMAAEQRKAEEERLRLAIEETKQREEEERRKKEEEERQRLEREEADKKAKEEAEKLRIEVAERLKREEKEREERRKRVEAIMSRTRKGSAAAGAATTPNSTPSKDNTEATKQATATDAASQQDPSQSQEEQQEQQQQQQLSNEDSNSTSGSTTTATTPTPPTVPAQNTPLESQSQPLQQQNSQAIYEQSVIDKETALINSFSNMIIDENDKNLQQQQQFTNGKLHGDYPNIENINNKNDINLLQAGIVVDPLNSSDIIDLSIASDGDTMAQEEDRKPLITTTTTTTTTVSNGNGHIENINNKNDINLLQGGIVVAPLNSSDIIDLTSDSERDISNFDNNNSLLTTTTTLVTADSHENEVISLL